MLKKNLFLPLLLAAMALTAPAGAYTTETLSNGNVRITSSSDIPVFDLHFFRKGEGNPDEEFVPDIEGPSSREFTREEKEAVIRAAGYWADILNPSGISAPAIISLMTDDEDGNASATSPAGDEYTRVQEALLLGARPPDRHIHHGYVFIGSLLSTFDLNGQQNARPWNLETVMIHELGHALGLTVENPAFKRYLEGVDGDMTFGGPIAMSVYNDVNSIVGGTLTRRVPMDHDSPQEDSHFGLAGQLMTHRAFRNYATFSEVEMAALNDIGFNIALRDHFGLSIYTDGNTVNNTRGFGADWDAANGQYNVNKPSLTPYALGLHIYGSENTVNQLAHIRADGPGAGGIRVDGVGNTVNIGSASQNVQVTADGSRGIGLLVSYGSGHMVNLASGSLIKAIQGDAVRFDIGANSMDEMKDADNPHYGACPLYSYYEVSPFIVAQGIAPEFEGHAKALAGPLVESFNVHGALVGGQSAISISANSHVEAVNVHGGALIVGDILSSWARNTLGDEGKATTVTFGQPGTSGTMHLVGDIAWSGNDAFTTIPVNSLDIVQGGGHLSFNGNANVYSWQVNEGASLGGNSTITIDGLGQRLYNAGLISPGNSIGKITIEGDYTQSAGGRLLIEFMRTAMDQFIVTGNAIIDPEAVLSLQALPDFYPTGSLQLTNAALFGHSQNLVAQLYNHVTLLMNSPTLAATLDVTGAGLAVNVSRPPDAYSRHASSSTGSSLGKALTGVAEHAAGDMQNLFAAIDFSRSGGAGVRSALRQLTPTAYDNTAKASLQTGHALSGLLLERLAASGPPASPRGVQGMSTGSESLSNSAFIQPFGGYFGQNAQGDNQGFDAAFAGIVGGVNRQFDNGLAGVHTAIIHRKTNNRSDASVHSRANGIRLGVHGSLHPHEGFFVNGLVNAGFENVRMTRNVEIDEYHRKNNAEYTGVTAQSAVRAGYEWQSGNMRFGPLAGLDYGFYHRPPVSETGGQATRLTLDAANFHSLRTAVGGQARGQTLLADDLTLQAGLSAQWAQELLDTSYGSRASFRGYGGNTFSVTNRTDDRNALVLNASVTLISGRNLSLNAYAGTEFFRKRSNTVQGGLSTGWSF